jgi:hypothetical protein
MRLIKYKVMGSRPPCEKNSCLWLETKGMLASSAEFCPPCREISKHTRFFCVSNGIPMKGVCLRLHNPPALFKSDPQSPRQRTTRANRDRAALQPPRRDLPQPPPSKRTAPDNHASSPGERPTSSLNSPSLQSWKRGATNNMESRPMLRNKNGSSPGQLADRSIAPQSDHAASPLGVPHGRVIRYATRVSCAINTKRFVAEPANGSTMYNRESRRMMPRNESSPGQLVDRSIGAPQNEHAARRPQRDQHAQPSLIQTAKNDDNSSSGEFPASPSSPMVLESPPRKLAGRVPVDRSISSQPDGQQNNPPLPVRGSRGVLTDRFVAEPANGSNMNTAHNNILPKSLADRIQKQFDAACKRVSAHPWARSKNQTCRH